MREISELSENEAGLVNRLIEVYPAALGYDPDRDPPVLEVATELIEEGMVDRIEISEDEGGPQVAYRLPDARAQEIRTALAFSLAAAQWN